MDIVQIRRITKSIDNRLDFFLVLGYNRKPHIVFVTADVIVRNRRDFIHDRSKLFHRSLRMRFCRKIKR